MSGMRAPDTEPTGTAGQSFVKGQFEEMGWAPVPNPEHDVGTDIWIAARDTRRFDLRSLVGAQVKSGQSFFSEPERNNGVVIGWWYRDNKDHFEYWTQHKVPHLLILHDNVLKVSYWVHITADSVVSTGKGAKILVSIDSIIGISSVDELLKVATSNPNVKEWEGSAWKLGHSVPESSEMRYALITPRLIAPHGNSSIQTISSPQAIALLVQMRLREINMYREKQSLLDPTAAAGSAEMGWRLYAALYQWIVNDSLQHLQNLDDQDQPNSLRAAITVCCANALFDAGRPHDALVAIESLLAEDTVNPVDDGWLRAHRMRCLVDTGRLQDAQTEAGRVHALRSVAPDDPTARALAGVGSVVILNTGGFFDQSAIAEAVQSSDNLASWWRSQTFVAALEKQTSEGFKAWGNDISVTFGADDVVGNRLLSTMLIAGFMADSSAWKSSTKLLCMHRLMSFGTDEGVVMDCLRRLTRVGVDKEVNLATRRLLGFGPVEPVAKLANSIELSRLTRSSLKSTLALLSASADVLNQSTCDLIAEWALKEITDDDASTTSSLNTGFMVREAIISTLSATIEGCSASARRTVMDHILELPIVSDQSAAHEYSKLVENIESELWGADDIAKLADREGDNFELREAIEHVVANRDEEFRGSLISRVRVGEFSALVSFGDVTALPEDAAVGMIAALSERVTSQTNEARNGISSHGTQDPLRALVVLNMQFPNVAKWEPVIEALAEVRSDGSHLEGGIRTLGFYSDKIPRAVSVSIHDSLKRLMTNVPGLGFADLTGGRADTRGVATLAVSNLYPDEFSHSDLAQLVQGSPRQRSAAVQIIGVREEVSNLALLSMLANDPELNVRRAASYFLARWVLRGIGLEDSGRILRGLIKNSGVRIATAASDALTDTDGEYDVTTLVEVLSDSPSIYVRKRIDGNQP